MITFSTPNVICKNGIASLVSDVLINSEKHTLFFSVSEEYADGLCTERSDAFVIAALIVALRDGHDITFEAPLSLRLYYQLEYGLIDFLVKTYAERGFRRIKLHGPISKEMLPTMGGVGTGISCGVDSLAAFIRQSGEDLGSMKLSHLCFFDAGSHGIKTDDLNASLRLERLELAKTFCSETDYPLVYLRSNIHDLFFETYGFTHVYNSMSAVLALQKMFDTYYYASGCTIWEFLSEDSDPAYYQPYLMQQLSTETTTMYMSEATMTRFEKTQLLSDNELSKRFLNVCNVQGINCGHCNKCVRTLLTLDILGVLDDYTEVFDVMDYRKNKNKHLAYHYLMCLKKSAIHLEIHEQLKVTVPFRGKCMAIFRFFRSRCKILLAAIVHKVQLF